MAIAESTIKIMEAPPADAPDDLHSLQTPAQRRKLYREELMKGAAPSGRLQDFLRQKRIELKGRHFLSHSKHLQDIDQMVRYVNGDQYGSYDPTTGEYLPYSRMPNETCYSIPVINGHVALAIMQLIKTELKYDCDPKDNNNPNHTALSSMCGMLGNEEADRLLEEENKLDECWNSVMAGESYRCLIWGARPDSPKTSEIPEYEEEGFETPDTKQCKACGNAGMSVDVEACENCSADYLETVPGLKQTRQKFKGTKRVPVGENILHIPHLTSVKRDLSNKLQYSTYIIESDYITNKKQAEWQYQTIIEEGYGYQTGDEAIRLQQAQQHGGMQTDAVAGSSREGWIGPDRPGGGMYGGIEHVVGVPRDHIWLDPSEYGDVWFDQDEILPNGMILPARTLMGDFFAQGFKYCMVGNTVVTADKANHRRQWSVVLYGKKPGSSCGSGLQLAIVLQDIVNDTFNLDYSILMSSIPFRAAVKKFVKTLPPAGSMLFLDSMPSGGINQAIAQFPAQTGSGLVGATAQRIQEATQFILGTNSLAGQTGAPDTAVMATATGVAAAHETVNGRAIAPNLQRIACDKRFRMQILDNIREYSSPEQREELARRFGPDTVEEFFKQTNFEHVVTWSVVKGSEKPKSDALTHATTLEFGQMAAALAKTGLPWVNEFLQESAEMLGLPYRIVPGADDRREAEYRLNKLAAFEKAALEKNPRAADNTDQFAGLLFDMLQESCGPLSLAAAEEAAKELGGDGQEGVVPFIFMQDHQTFGDAYKDALLSEEAKMWTDARKAVVIRLWSEHFIAALGAESMKAQFTSALAQKLGQGAGSRDQQHPMQKISESINYKDAPDDIRRQMEEAAGMKPSQEAPPDEQTAEHNAQAGAAILDHHHSQLAADAEKERQIEVDNAQTKNKMLVEGHKAELAIAVAKATPKPSPGAKK